MLSNLTNSREFNNIIGKGPVKIGILSLGCPKNLVDSEALLGDLANKGYKIVDEVAKSDIAIVNTCAFIEDAKKESIDAILDLIQLKKEGKIKKVIVAGCLSQRYNKALRKELKEVDAFLGIRDFSKNYAPDRFLITPPHFAYVKISDGCDNKCNYCVISKIRGSYKSRAVGSIVKEIRKLHHDSRGRLGEVNLVSQDLTYYGMDLYGKLSLAKLLYRLDEGEFVKDTKNIKWIRLLYAHPAHFTDEFIGAIKNIGRVCKYIDLPVQHINDKILKTMGRKVTKKYIFDLIYKLRSNIPGIAIRSSLIVGLPGEGEKEFKELLEFMNEVKFERLGIFTYSREEDTPAYNFKNQVSENIKKQRFQKAMQLQQDISNQINKTFLGKTITVLIDEKDVNDPASYIARSYADAPEVDGQVYVKNVGSPLRPGDFVDVKITDTFEYDLVGEYESAK